MVKRALLALALAACQGHDAPPSSAPRHDARAVITALLDAESAGSGGNALATGGTGSGSGATDETDPPPDPGKLIDDLGAIPAWQAVVDRGQYLARRGQHGVIYGTLGPVIQVPDPTSDGGLVPSPFTWLIDDTEGNGALAIRVELGKLASKAKQGDRVALAGAWKLDESLHYYWATHELTAVPPAPPSDIKDPPSPPCHTIIDGGMVAGGRMISLAKDGDIVYFQVVGRPPAVDGDGWPVADELGNPVIALLNLPGERPSFGAQDFRTPDERWHLKRAQTYWVRIGKIRKHGPDKPATINARTAPVRVK